MKLQTKICPVCRARFVPEKTWLQRFCHRTDQPGNINQNPNFCRNQFYNRGLGVKLGYVYPPEFRTKRGQDMKGKRIAAKKQTEDQGRKAGQGGKGHARVQRRKAPQRKQTRPRGDESSASRSHQPV